MSIQILQADWILGAGSEPVSGGLCQFDTDSGQIRSVSSAESVETSERDFVTILTPGLINGHTHLELFTEHPIPCEVGESMGTWLLEAAKFNRELTQVDRLRNVKASLSELFATGCTFVNDVSCDGSSAQIMQDMGMRGRVCLEFFHPQHAIQQTILDNLKYQDLKSSLSKNDLIQAGVSPHSPYNVSLAGLNAVLDQHQSDWIHVHVAESEDEVRWFKGELSLIDTVHERFLGQRFGAEKKGKTSFEHIQMSFEHARQAQWVLVHGNYLTASDLYKIAQEEMKLVLVYCPLSNAWLKHQPLNTAEILARKIPLVFGTDSRLSNLSLDLRAEARAGVQRGMSLEDAFSILTCAGAQALGQNTLGQIKEGYQTDLVLWQVPKCSGLSPLELFFAAEAVVDQVIISGKQVYAK